MILYIVHVIGIFTQLYIFNNNYNTILYYKEKMSEYQFGIQLNNISFKLSLLALLVIRQSTFKS